MNANPAPPLRDIVLLGGGHANVQVLKAFAMRPEPGLRLTIVAREPHSPYSGMLPGLVAGVYAWEGIHIDLARLAAFAGARFIAAEATGIDPERRQLLFADRPPLRYDVLAINTGGVPGQRFASSFVTPVKPIGRFLPVWQELVEGPEPLGHVTIVGAGAGGVELALAIGGPELACTVVDAADAPLTGFAAAARRRVSGALDDRRIELLTGFEVVDADDGMVFAADGRQVQTDHVLWVTGVEAPAWPAQAGLATDASGFIAVDEHLQSVSHPDVFAAGDVAAPVGQPRSKSGVYAVRQGPFLANNVRRYATGRRLRLFRAQRRALAIIGLGEGRALASRGRWAVSGTGVWRLKQWIDRRFIRKFSDLPAMPQEPIKIVESLRSELPEPMRCGGCGAKLGADILRRVLDRLDVQAPAARVVQGIGDDAAVVQVAGGDIAMSCDGFRAMIDDPYRFGRIGGHHALNDLFAMGADPAFALALATVPAMADALMEEDLFQMMAGAVSVFREHGVALVGGHSAEGAELGIAFSVTGTLTGAALAKGGLEPGQRLVLTKPLGTGALLAGAMQGRTRAADLVTAIATMDISNAPAVAVLRASGATACTDVTGFGLAGHLTEMTRASSGGVGACLDVDAIPELSGALDLIENGTISSLQENNEQALSDFTIIGLPPNAPEVRLLADPQTAGGLLASVPPHRAEDCVRELRDAGFTAARIIGEVVEGAGEIRRS